MRIVYAILAVLLLLFAVAQYNDPDAVFWIAAYGVGAIWCALAALRSSILHLGPVRILFTLSFLLAIVGCIWFWPTVSNWWDINVWWPELTGETSREGMGMMVLTVCLAIASFGVLRRG